MPLLSLLRVAGQRFVAEVPINFWVRRADGEAALEVDQLLSAADARGGRRLRIARQTGPDPWWRGVDMRVRVAGRDYLLLVAINEATAEVKYLGDPLPSASQRASHTLAQEAAA